jgi:hypothetical protein
MFTAYAVFHRVQFGALELRDLSALEADQVLVDWALGKAMLVALEALSEVMLGHQSTSHQQV